MKLGVLVLMFCCFVPLVWGQDFTQGLDKVPRVLAATSEPARPNTLKPAAGGLPSSIDLSAFLPPVRTQGPIGSCAAWSTVYYVRTLLEQRERSWGADVTEHEFSPLFSYLQLTGGRNEGTSITDHMRLLRDQGGVSLVDFPVVNRLDQPPPESLFTRPTNLKIASYKSVPRKDNSVDLDAVRSLLAEGNPVVGGFELFSDFYKYKGGIYRTVEGTVVGGHAMAVIGYDDDKQALLLVNSWDKTWGEQGKLWLSYESVKAMTHKNYGFAVMFDQVDAPPVVAPPADVTASKGAAEEQISVSWTEAPGATGYQVFRANNQTQNWTLLATTRAAQYADQPLPPGVNYVYAIKSLSGPSASPRVSDLSPIAEGWTQKKNSAPGIVEGLDAVLYKDTVLLVWNALAATDQYQILRYDASIEEYLLLGTSKDAVFRDLAPFEKAETATYCIVAVNAQGVGQPSALTAVTRTAPPSAPELSRQVPALLKKAADDKVVKGKAASPYRGTFYEPNWFDPAFLAKTFNDYATQEKEAFARWKANDQADFEEFLKNDHP